jgi:hypothetical protein
MSAARKYLLYSTIAGLFSSSLVYSGALNIQFFYLLMVANLCLMMLMRRLQISVGLLALIAFLAFSGGLGILRGTDTITRVAKELLGISISATYFCCFFRAIGFDVELCVKTYARFAYWVAIIGILIYLPDWILFNQYRLHSVLHEPAMFAFTCLPALYYFADRWLTERIFGKELLVMSVAFVLCQSSTGFIGVLVGVCIFGFRFPRARVLTPFMIGIVGTVLYYSSSDFALRLGDSVSVAQGEDVSKVNLSTYALYSNIYVTKQVLSLHPIMGNGLGSHGKSYDQYVAGVPGIEAYLGSESIGLNAEDASSLANRILSEMGILGLAVSFWFIWHFRPEGYGPVDTLCKGICVYFAVALLREGVYFSNEEWFFIIFYALHKSAAKSYQLLLERRGLYSTVAAYGH